MIIMVVALTVGGLIQITISRVMGEGYIAAQPHMLLWYGVRLAGGLLFFIGFLPYVKDFIIGLKQD